MMHREILAKSSVKLFNGYNKALDFLKHCFTQSACTDFSVEVQPSKKCVEEMQSTRYFFFFLLTSLVLSEQVHKLQITEDHPRLFFKQVIDASGLFPIEINVPDVLSTMASAMSSFGQSTYSLLSGSSPESVEKPVNQDQNEVFNAEPSSAKRQKKVKKLKTGFEDDLENLLDWLSFVTIQVYLF